MHLNSILKVFAIILMAAFNTSECYCAYHKITDQIYFDVEIDGVPVGRIVFGLFGEVVPNTVANFKKLALEGINGKSYEGTKFLIAVKKAMILGGDIFNNDGTGSLSIYGEYFEDENFDIKHDSAELLAMANFGNENSNGCMFYITTMPTPWLDEKNVVFGRVIKGYEMVHKIEYLKTDVNDRILKDVRVTKCGEIKTKPYYENTKNYEITLWAWFKAGWFPLSFSFAILAFFQYLILKLNKLKSFQ